MLQASKEINFNKFAENSELTDESRNAFVALLELIQRCRADIEVFAREMLGIELNEFQLEFLRHTTTPRKEWHDKFGTIIDDVDGLLFGRNIANPSNQIGKTVMIAVKHIYFGYFKMGMDLEGDMLEAAHYSTLNLSPQSRQTKACYNYVKDILSGNFLIQQDGQPAKLNKVHVLLKGFLEGENLTLGELRFANGSVMYSVPTGHDQASSLAGGQYGYISYDECSQSLHLKEELGAKIASRLIKYGVCLDLISTPEVDCPSHQHYAHLVALGLKGKEGWWALGGRLDQNKFLPTAQRERVKRDLLSLDKKKYRQVVFGEFVTGGKKFFDTAEVENVFRLGGRQPCLAGHKYVLVADWGMADNGDESVFMVLDYTSTALDGKMYLVAHETITGGSPHMQFALLRTLYEAYTFHTEESMIGTPPTFLMDAAALGGVTIKKLLVGLKPRGFNIEKDEALLILKQQLSANRSFTESPVDGSITERNPKFGNVVSYFIEDLNVQLGYYQIDDLKITQDYVMCLMMGVAWIVKKTPRAGKKAEINTLAGHAARIIQPAPGRGGALNSHVTLHI